MLLPLLTELGRYLACLGEGTADLNHVLYQQISKESAGSHRLNRCLQMLNGYPDWEGELRHELEDFASGLSENECRARLMGKEIDAALDDPRWVAQRH